MNTEKRRAKLAAQILANCQEVNDLEDRLAKAIVKRDKSMIAAHGDKTTGGLSYQEMADASGTTDKDRIGRGRVIQIVQGKSEYSKRQPKRNAS